SASPPINKRGSIEVDPSVFVNMEAMLPDTDVATEAAVGTGSGTTGSCRMAWKYPLSQFQHAPNSGSPGYVGGYFCFHVQAPACRSLIQRTLALPVPACPHVCCSCCQIACPAASATACCD